MTTLYVDQEISGDIAPPEVKLRLRRAAGATVGAPAVLILHGGNTCSEIYTVPDGGLAGYLVSKGYDVWLLDWRGSRYVIEPLLARAPLGGSARSERAFFTFERAAAADIPAALRTIRDAVGPEPRLGLVSWCLSGAVSGIALSQGLLEPFAVSACVLMTLGLFCETPWNGWLKAEDYLLERVLSRDETCRAIDPVAPHAWPEPLRTAYQRWPSAWLPRGEELLKPLSFMVGQPFALERLHPELQRASLKRFFGPLHLGLYLQAGQMVRRGFVAPFDAPEVIDRARLDAALPLASETRLYLNPRPFQSTRVTLISAAENRVWHRDSIDLMYEWLRNNGCANCAKRVMPSYNIMELLWGANARNDVFPAVENGLQSPRPAQVARAAE